MTDSKYKQDEFQKYSILDPNKNLVPGVQEDDIFKICISINQRIQKE